MSGDYGSGWFTAKFGFSHTLVRPLGVKPIMSSVIVMYF